MADLTSLFSLSRSAVVQAGAGTGKTHSLITLALHLLGGVRRTEPLAPARLCAITFTEKAAAELKARLRGRVDRVIEGGLSPETEPELSATCAAPGISPPPRVLWERARRELGLAQIGTIHGLCGQILRRHAAAAGIDPSFTILDEVESRLLLTDACETAILDALETRGPAREAARRLCAELGFRGNGRFGRGLADELDFLLAALAENGRTARALVEETEGLSVGAALEADAAARAALSLAMDRLEAEFAGLSGQRAGSSTGRLIEKAIEDFRELGASALASLPRGELSSAWPRLRSIDALSGQGSSAVQQAAGAAKDALEALLEADAHARACGLARDLALLADLARARYRDAKAAASALDFDDLVRLTRDLLARDLRVRREEKARISALLVDEFQDTSRAQIELVGWLSEGAEQGSAPAGSGRPGAPPIAPAALVVVGDRKQSIYEFRGADVAGAQAFAAQALRDGAELHLLRESRRSPPALVSFTNALFRRALSRGDRPFDAPFRDGEDDLVARRPEGGPGPCAELLRVAKESVEAEADAVSRRIARLLAPGAEERVFERAPDGGERPRPVRGGDVAILLRRFTHVDVFRRALLRRHVPHLVLNGGGFFGVREIGDLLQLLELAVDPDDALALAAVLRSPLGPVSDEGLVLLAVGPRQGPSGAERGHGLRHWALEDPAALATLAPDDAEVVARVGRLIRSLQREAGRVGPAALLEAALAETDFLAACAGGLYGEQAAANVDKLLSLARAHELRGGSVVSFVARMRRMAEEEAAEAEAPVVEERDPHAVRILTVHRAKGLEFPVVVVPECGVPSRLRGAMGNVLVDQDLGLALRVRGADGARRWGPHGERLRDLRKERDLAQSRRLFYVAATRARDLLILCGREAPREESWRGWVDMLLQAGADGLLRVVVDGETATGAAKASANATTNPTATTTATPTPTATPTATATPTTSTPTPSELDAELGAARRLVARIERGTADAAQATVVASVTQLADAWACPRRYQLLHEARIEEWPRREETASEDSEEQAGDPAELGTVAHRLLELLPLAAGADRERCREELRRILEGEGCDAQRPQHAALIETVADFAASQLGRRMAQALPGRLLRELPFALRLAPESGEPAGPALVVRGQLDALLLDDGAATVVDYKLSGQRDPERYAFQLDAYALAAHTLVEETVPVRTGLVFLRSPGTPFRERAGIPPLADIRRRLLAAGKAIAYGRRTGTWPKVEPTRCRELGCGFLLRCHPEERDRR